MMNIPTFTLPSLITRLGTQLGHYLPQWPHAVALTTTLNVARKTGILPADSLEALEGRSFRVSINDTATFAAFEYLEGQFHPIYTPTGEEDLRFSANLSAYLQLLARQEDPDTLFFNRQLAIEGDTELGLIVKNMLDAIEWPPRWLEQLREKLQTLRPRRSAPIA